MRGSGNGVVGRLQKSGLVMVLKVSAGGGVWVGEKAMPSGE